MKKTYVIDTNILIQAPHAFLCFEENDVVRMLEQYRNQGDLLQGVTLPDGGTLRIEKNYKAVELPEDMPEDKADKIQEIFERGIIQTEALNFIRGCSIAKIYLIIDDAQNMTLNQVRGIITRAGKGTKIILLGDPCQIDRPFLDERTNGLSYAAKYMQGSPYCAQLTLSAEECERSLLANDILRRMDIPFTDRATIVSAIGHHDESTGGAVDIVSAAMIIADKTDVRRSRVRSHDKSTYDIHDWVNYAVTEANLKINREKRQIALELKIDEKICTMYEYFDIFLGRMQMCRHGAELFGAKFKLTANGSKVL